MRNAIKELIRRSRNKKGFTLVEMILVMFIVAILMLLIVPNMAAQRERLQTQGDQALVKTVETQKALYKTVTGTDAPANLAGMEEYLTSEQIAEYPDAQARLAAP